MKKIDAYFDDVIQMNCNCLGGDDYIQLQRYKNYDNKDDQEIYYVKFIDKCTWDFKTRLRTFFKIRKDWKSFIDGKEQDYNGIYFNYDQLEQFNSYLYNDAINNKILSSKDIIAINKWTPKSDFKIYPWSDDKNDEFSNLVLFKSFDDLVLSIDIYLKENIKYLLNIKFSWAYSKITTKKDIKDYTRRFLFNKNNKNMCQENELFLYKQDLVDLFGVMNFLISNIKTYGDKYKLTL